jgi:hypothetical protein
VSTGLQNSIIVIIIVIIVDGEYRVYDTQLTKFPGISLADNIMSLKEYITLEKLAIAWVAVRLESTCYAGHYSANSTSHR